MPPTRILIDVPNTQRDLLALAYLKILLEENGFQAKMVEGNSNGLLRILTYRPHAIIVAQVSEIHGSTLAKYAKAIGSKVIVLRTEGIIGARDIPTLTSTKFVGSFPQFCDLDLVWGESFKNAVVKNTDLPEGRVKVCGNPRYDFYLPPLSGFFLTKQELCEKYGFEPSEKLVCYTSNLVFADLLLETVKGNVNYLDEYGWLVHEREKHIAQRDVTTVNFLRLASELEGVNFLLKLHPWEDSQYYVDKLAEQSLPNVKIADKDELIGNVVKNTDLLLQVNSTTSTEAWIFGKPVLTMAFLPEYDHEFGDFIKGNLKASNYAQFISTAKKCLEDPSISPPLQKARDEFVREWYYFVDGKSTQRVANAISSFLGSSKVRLNAIPSKKRELLELAANVDSVAAAKYVIYNNHILRNAYLKFRWNRSKKARLVLDQAYRKTFKEQAKEAEEKIRKLLGA